MNTPQQLNISCDFDGFLVCKIHKDVVKVELKIKTKCGKYMLLKDFYTRMENIDLGKEQTDLQESIKEEHPTKRESKCNNSAESNTTSTDSVLTEKIYREDRRHNEGQRTKRQRECEETMMFEDKNNNKKRQCNSMCAQNQKDIPVKSETKKKMMKKGEKIAYIKFIVDLCTKSIN